jgi:hypothetical protein
MHPGMVGLFGKVEQERMRGKLCGQSRKVERRVFQGLAVNWCRLRHEKYEQAAAGSAFCGIFFPWL